MVQLLCTQKPFPTSFDSLYPGVTFPELWSCTYHSWVAGGGKRTRGTRKAAEGRGGKEAGDGYHPVPRPGGGLKGQGPGWQACSVDITSNLRCCNCGSKCVNEWMDFMTLGWNKEKKNKTIKVSQNVPCRLRYEEGNGNPLQYSCLENPRDGGAWWAAVYGVSQSQTRLKWHSSSSSNRLR